MTETQTARPLLDDTIVIANVSAEAASKWTKEQTERATALINMVRQDRGGLSALDAGTIDNVLDELAEKFAVGEDDIVLMSEEEIALAREARGDEAQPEEGEEKAEDPEAIMEADGQTAMEVGDEPTITTEVLGGVRPSKAELKLPKPKAIAVDHNFNPGDALLLVLWGVVDEVGGLGGATRVHDCSIIDQMLWPDNANLKPGEAFTALAEQKTRGQLTRNIIDGVLFLMRAELDPCEEGAEREEGYVGPFDEAIEAIREKARDRYHVKINEADEDLHDADVVDSELIDAADADGVIHIEASPEEVKAAADAATAEKIAGLQSRWDALVLEIDGSRKGTKKSIALIEEQDRVRRELVGLGAPDPDAPAPPAADPEDPADGASPTGDEVEQW